MDKFTIENLDLFYGDFKALKSINLHIQPREITAFIGPSGCGKSTLLKSLNRMNDLVEGCRITGTALLDGEDIYGDMDINLLRKRVGAVYKRQHEDQDLYFLGSVPDEIFIKAIQGDYMVFFPSDVHRPGTVVAGAETYRKVVVKVSVDTL